MKIVDLAGGSQTVRFVTTAKGIDLRDAAPDFVCLVRLDSICSGKSTGEAIRDVSESWCNSNS